MIFTNEFWQDTLERAVYTVAETALGVLGTSMYMEQINWQVVLSASILAGIITVLKCIAVKGGDSGAGGTLQAA